MDGTVHKVERRLAEIGPRSQYNFSWVAARCGMSKSNLSKWRSRQLTRLGADKAARIVRLLNGAADPEDSTPLPPPSPDLVLTMADFGYHDVVVASASAAA